MRLSKFKGWVALLSLALALVGCSDAVTPTVLPATVGPTAQAVLIPTATTLAVPTPVPTALPPTVTPTRVPPTVTATPVPPTATPTPPPTKDGRWVAYIGPDGTLYAGRADGSNQRKVDQNVQNVEWSSDGSQFIFYKPADGFVSVAAFDGSSPHRLGSVAGIGRWSAATGNVLISPSTSISRTYSVVSGRDGKLQKSFDLPPTGFTRLFDLTQDAQSAVYSRVVSNTGATALLPAEYHLLDLTTRQDRLLSSSLAQDLVVWNADFSEIIGPDTKSGTLKAVSLKTGQSRDLGDYGQLVTLRRDGMGRRLFWVNPLATVKVDGTGLKRYTDAKAIYAGGGLPNYYFNAASDGSSLIYADSSSNQNGGGVYYLDVATSKISRLADNDVANPTTEIFAGASQDNKLMAFTVRTSNTGIYTIKEVGTGRVVGQLAGLPYWQPLPA